MYRTIVALLAASACVSTLQAQTRMSVAPAPMLTLDDAFVAALANSPALEASHSGVRAAEARRTIAGLRPNPTLDAMAENVGGSGDYRGFRSTETTVGLSVPLELGGKRSARVAVADAQLGRAGLDAAVALADLRQRVTQTYNEAVASQRRSTNAREQVGIATEGLRVARVRVVSGRASPLEEQRADVARLTAEGTAERAERSAEVALANLARLTGRPATQLDGAWFGRIESMGPSRPVEAGGTLAAPIAGHILADIYGTRGSGAWTPPPGVIGVELDRTTGKPADASTPSDRRYTEWYLDGTEPGAAPWPWGLFRIGPIGY